MLQVILTGGIVISRKMTIEYFYTLKLQSSFVDEENNSPEVKVPCPFFGDMVSDVRGDAR